MGLGQDAFGATDVQEGLLGAVVQFTLDECFERLNRLFESRRVFRRAFSTSQRNDLFELGWRHVVQCLVNSPVIEPVDVGERRPFDVLDVAPGSATMNQLGLVETVEGFGEGIDAPICQELIMQPLKEQFWHGNLPSLDRRLLER